MPWFFTPYKVYDYIKVWSRIVSRNKTYGTKSLFRGAFTDWDNTPRFRENSVLFKNVSTDLFQVYLTKLVKNSSTEFIFINAWNEWAEGAYLEPDENNKYGFIQAVNEVNSKLMDGELKNL